MTVTVQSTEQIVEINGIKARVWVGATANGIKVQMLVPRIAANKGEDLSQFERELEEKHAPTVASQAFPLRLIL